MFKRSGVWWTCIRHNGRKIQKSLETSDKILAKKIEAKVRVEIVEGNYFEKLIGRHKTFKDMMEKFMQEHAPKVSSSMQRSYKTSSKHLISFFGDSNLLSISPKMISRYKVLRRDEGIKPATINRELAMISKAFNLAFKEWEWIRENPVARVPKEKENNEIDRWLTVDEERRLLENSPGWLREIIIFDLNSGLRQHELSDLEWSRVNLFRKTVLIQNTKNGKPRTIPLNKNSLDVLVHRSKVKSFKNDYVFLNRNGKKIDPNNLRTSFYIALKKSGIENFRFHDLRHTFATRLAMAGIDLYKISKLLGHKDISTTQRYAHHCSDSLRDGVEILETDYNLTTVEEEGVQNLS